MLAGFTLDDGPAAVLKAARIVANVSARGLTIVASSTSSPSSMISSASMSILLGAHPAGVFCTDGGRSTYPRLACPAAMPVSADNGANGKVLASLSASTESVEPTGHESLSILLCGMVPSEYIRTLRSMSAVTSGAAPGGTSSVIVDGPALDVPLWMYRTTSTVSLVACHPASSVNSHRFVTRSVRGSRSARPHTSTYATRSRVDSGRLPENDATSPHGTASDVLMSRPGPPPPRAVQTGQKTALGRP